jgi:L-iditol 2-dehydrogenase
MNIPKTMKALVAYSKTDHRLETAFPVPEINDDEMLIKTEACGICAGDLKCKHGAARFWGDENNPSWVKPPFIPGHEFLGHVVKIGKNVTKFKVGDRITPDQIIPCGECRFCKTGKYWMCQPHDMFGFQSYNNGGMAEYVRIPQNAVVHLVPEEIPTKKAVLVEPFSCSKHCIDRAQIGSEDIVVLSGAGTLGLGMITYAHLRGPKLLIVLDLKDERLEMAKKMGADLVWNPLKVDVVEKIMALTDGYGCDTYIEATGAPASVQQGMKMIRKLGRFVEFSVFGKETTLDWSVIGDQKELDVLGSHLSPYCFPYVIENIGNGNPKTEGIVSTVLSLDEWEKGFEKATGKDGDYKVAFTF